MCVCVCSLTPPKLHQWTPPNLHRLRTTAWKVSSLGQRSPSYCCSGILLSLPFFLRGGQPYFKLPFPVPVANIDHASNHRSVLIFFCTLSILFTCTEGHALWWSLSYTKLLASLFIWSTVARSTDMTWPLMDHCHGPLPSFTGPTIGVEALSPNHRRRCAGAWAPEQRSPPRAGFSASSIHVCLSSLCSLAWQWEDHIHQLIITYIHLKI